MASSDMTHPLSAQVASARPHVRQRRSGRACARAAGSLTVRFFSPALHRRADYVVYLPPGYSRRQRYPVYYLLHGMPGGPQHFMTMAQMDQRLVSQMALHRARPMILVYPDGRIGGRSSSDSEWANTSAGAYDSYVIDVLHDVDHRFATLARRQDRVIAGCSAGAYGAVNVALHHLSDFGSVQSWSGYFLQTKSGVFAHASHAAPGLQQSPRLHQTAALHARDLPAARLHHRRARRPGLQPTTADGADSCASTARACNTTSIPAGHGWGVWIPHLNEMLDMASADMTHPLASVSNPGRRARLVPVRVRCRARQTPSGGAGAPGGGAAAHRPQRLDAAPPRGVAAGARLRRAHQPRLRVPASRPFSAARADS